MLSVVITGAHSGIGQDLVRSLCANKVRVIGLITPWCDEQKLFKDSAVTYMPCDLKLALSSSIKEMCKEVDILVHLAWARPKKVTDALEDNLMIYQNIMDAMPSAIKTVYMSSVCATKGNPSCYGQAKYALSQKMDPARTVEIIAGLVKSQPAMGPYLALENFVCKLHAAFKFLPSPMALVADDVNVRAALERAVLDFESCPSLYAAYDPAPVRLNDLIKGILTDKKVFALPIPVPTGLTVFALKLARRFVPSVSISDRLITLLTVNPDEIAARFKDRT